MQKKYGDGWIGKSKVGKKAGEQLITAGEAERLHDKPSAKL